MKALSKVAAFLASALVAFPASASTYQVGEGGFGSIQEAVNAAMSGPNQNQGGNAIIEVAPGTWKGPSVSGPTPNAGGPIGNGYLHIKGSGSGETIIEDNEFGGCGTIIATNNASMIVEGVTLQTTSNSCQSALFVQNGAIMQVGTDVVFGPASVQHMHAEANAIIEIANDYTIAGGAMHHWGVSNGGYVEIDPKPLKITFASNVKFDVFAVAQTNGRIFVGENAEGSFVSFIHPEKASAGYRYSVESNAVIDLNGGRQPLPGKAHQAKTGGQYVNGP